MGMSCGSGLDGRSLSGNRKAGIMLPPVQQNFANLKSQHCSGDMQSHMPSQLPGSLLHGGVDLRKFLPFFVLPEVWSELSVSESVEDAGNMPPAMADCMVKAEPVMPTKSLDMSLEASRNLSAEPAPGV